jgi:hypothetical protein
MDIRYTVALIKIKKYNIINIEKKRRMTFIITEFYKYFVRRLIGISVFI